MWAVHVSGPVAMASQASCSEEKMHSAQHLAHASEILKFKSDALRYLKDHQNNPDMDQRETLGQFIKSHGYSQLLQEAYLIPICGCMWSCPSQEVLGSSASFVLLFFRKHHHLQFGHAQLVTVKGRSQSYVNKNIESTRTFLVTLYPTQVPNHVLLKWKTSHLVPSVAASKASLQLDQIQGKRGIWFCGTYQGCGFHEDGLKAGKAAAQSLHGKKIGPLVNPKQMVLS